MTATLDLEGRIEAVGQVTALLQRGQAAQAYRGTLIRYENGQSVVVVDADELTAGMVRPVLRLPERLVDFLASAAAIFGATRTSPASKETSFEQDADSTDDRPAS